MKHIQKQSPPTELVTYRNTPSASYKDLHDNHHDIWELTRLSLAEEQGYICCYCGQRITGFQGTVIEHIFPKGTPDYEIMQLDYENNLIASCDGGRYYRQQHAGTPSSDLHCDSAKGNRPVPMHPLDIRCETLFLYDESGDIFGIGSTAEATVNILNLNSSILKNNRKAAIESLTRYPITNWKKEYDRLNHRNQNGEYTEYCFVLCNYIELSYGVD